MPKRRISDRCIAKRLYDLATPYVQIIGWVAVLATTIFSAGAIWNRVDAYDARIRMNQEATDRQNDRIGALEKTQAVNSAQISYIYEWVKEQRR